jgi:hypothetical protein
MPKVTRRLRDNERHLIRSGHVFVFDERESGIKRWTDGLLWSPSRILYNFLVYRQIDTKLHIVKAQTNEQAKTASASASSARGSAPASVGSSAPSPTLPDPLALGVEQSNEPRRRVPSPPALPDARSAGDAAELERNLVGSLTNSYPFAKGGLCKKVSLPCAVDRDHSAHPDADDLAAGRRLDAAPSVVLQSRRRARRPTAHSCVAPRSQCSAHLARIPEQDLVPLPSHSDRGSGRRAALQPRLRRQRPRDARLGRSIERRGHLWQRRAQCSIGSRRSARRRKVVCSVQPGHELFAQHELANGGASQPELP